MILCANICLWMFFSPAAYQNHSHFASLQVLILSPAMYTATPNFLIEGVSGIKPQVIWKILRQPGLKYLNVPAIFTVYSGLVIVSKELVVITSFFGQ